MLRTTRLSSTSITRRVRAVGSLSGIRGCGWATERTSGDADELQFSFERFAIERLHHIFVGTRLDRGADMVDAVFGGAEDNARAFFASIVEIVERAEELHAAHHRPLPVEQDDVGPIDTAKSQTLLSIASTLDGTRPTLKHLPPHTPNN